MLGCQTLRLNLDSFSLSLTSPPSNNNSTLPMQQSPPQTMPAPGSRRLPPSQVDCKWWLKGYCSRGRTCHFRHDEAMAGQDNKKPEVAKVNREATSIAQPAIGGPSSSSSPDPSNDDNATSQQCAICFETPDTYGLLVKCDHVFCLDCLRAWRSSTTAPRHNDNELKSTSKTCPMCRSHSDFIIPSSIFPLPPETKGEENMAKKEIVDRYLERLKAIPCRYFQQSIENTSTPAFKPKCRFGNDCHYAHTHPITKEPYVFSGEELERTRRRPRRSNARILEELAVMEMIFEDFGGGYDSDDDILGSDLFTDDFFMESRGFGFADDLESELFGFSHSWVENDDFGYDYDFE